MNTDRHKTSVNQSLKPESRPNTTPHAGIRSPKSRDQRSTSALSSMPHKTPQHFYTPYPLPANGVPLRSFGSAFSTFGTDRTPRHNQHTHPAMLRRISNDAMIIASLQVDLCTLVSAYQHLLRTGQGPSPEQLISGLSNVDMVVNCMSPPSGAPPPDVHPNIPPHHVSSRMNGLATMGGTTSMAPPAYTSSGVAATASNDNDGSSHGNGVGNHVDLISPTQVHVPPNLPAVAGTTDQHMSINMNMGMGMPVGMNLGMGMGPDMGMGMGMSMADMGPMGDGNPNGYTNRESGSTERSTQYA